MAKVEKLYLSNHTLDINIRKCKYEQFDFSEVEDFVRELTGDREYQFRAIKELMIYLWGGSYKNVTELARENYSKKEDIQNRFKTEENFIRNLPLPDRLSGVVHMATGTGKSYVMFAIAYLSIVMGKTKRVLVLGPSSTVIERGLWGKFKEHLYGPTGQRLQVKLPAKYQNIPINLLNETEPITDNSIVIENINSIYNKDNNSIGDTLFSQTDEVLVLSDEVHHAYSHLSFSGRGYYVKEGGRGEDRDERLWMKFIREEPKITRHIGFTGTPYNQDEYFPDVIVNYSIKDAIEEQNIKRINPIIRTKVEDEKENSKLNLYQKFEQILRTHDDNREQYAYRDKDGNIRLKPITIFINPTQVSAQRNTEEFVKVLSEYLRESNPAYQDLSIAEMESIAREKVICVISKPTDDDYQEKLEQIEETNPQKVGGKVEFIFAVNKLSEGWDVDNVYQIVPMEERVFNSKLLISQVLGRGLRLPRKVPMDLIKAKYPTVIITNHERFAEHIGELMASVTDCEMRFISYVFPKTSEKEREKHNFQLFNMNYLPEDKTEDIAKEDIQTPKRTLILDLPQEKLSLTVDYLLEQKRFQLSKKFYTVDQIVSENYKRFKMREYEMEHSYDFNTGEEIDKFPEENDIEQVIRYAMKRAGFVDEKLSEHNRKQIEMFFNEFLPQSKKRVIRTNIEGDLQYIKTEAMDNSSKRAGELDRYTSIFISEDYEQELDDENMFVLKYLTELVKDAKQKQTVLDLFVPQEKHDYIRSLIPEKTIFVVNTSLFKTPQNMVILSHEPEKTFLFKLIENSKHINSFIRSRDMGFYSIDYEYFKKGKDRTRRAFNPDFFIKINIQEYMDKLFGEEADNDLETLKELQNNGIKTLIKVVEIKSDEDQEEVTRAKEKWAKEHFKSLNERLRKTNPINIEPVFREDIYSYYTFDLLHPSEYDLWFTNIRKGLYT